MEKSIKSVNTERKNVGARTTGISALINLFLTVIKFAGGIFFKSFALQADAIHSFYDLITDLFMIVSFRLTNEKSKLNKVGLFVEGIVSLMLLAFICVLFCPVIEIFLDAELTFGITVKNILLIVLIEVISAALKFWLYRFTIKKAREYSIETLELNASENKSDAITSLIVVVGLTLAGYLGGEWLYLDFVIAGIIGLVIIKDILVSFFKNGKLIISGSSSENDKVRRVLNNEEFIKEVTYLKTRKVKQILLINIKVKIDSTLGLDAVAKLIEETEGKIKRQFNNATFVSFNFDVDKRA